MGKVLVSLPYEGGVATVARRGRNLVLGGGTVIGDHLVHRVGIGDGRWIVGAVLPDGATRAILARPAGPLEAATGGGAWVAVIDDPAMWEGPPVRYETDAGEIVRPVLPAGWAREPLPDVTEPCPACEGTAWERVTPTDEVSRGGRGVPGGAIEPMPVIVCLRCGHEESEGAWYASDDEGEPVDYEPPAPPSDVRFPAYARVGGPSTIDGWGANDSGVHSVRIGDVETEDVEFAPLDGVREASAGVLATLLEEDGPWPDEGSRATLSLWLSARTRRTSAAIATAVPFTTELQVDGQPVAFEGLRRGPAWGAVGRVGAVRLTVGSRDIPPEAFALRRLSP